MNVRNCIRSTTLAALTSTLALACGATDGTGQAGAPAEPEVGSVSSTLLASVQGTGGETVEFRENGAGNLVVVDTFAYGAAKRMMTTDFAKLMPSEIYARLSGNAEVPQALVDAEVRFNDVAHAEHAAVAPPPAAAATAAFYDFNQWFQGAACTGPNTIQCTGVTSGPVIGTVTQSTVFTGIGGLDGRATGPATLQEAVWNGSAWINISNTTVNPGTAVWVTQYNAPPAFHFANITTAPGGGEEDLAEQSFLPTVVGTQTSGNTMSFSGNYWFAAQDVEVGLGDLPGFSADDYLDFQAVSNGSFFDPQEFLPCNTKGSGHTPLRVLAKSSFPTWVNESAVEFNYVQQGCF